MFQTLKPSGPANAEYHRSLLNPEVKQYGAVTILGWETIWELQGFGCINVAQWQLWVPFAPPMKVVLSRFVSNVECLQAIQSSTEGRSRDSHCHIGPLRASITCFGGFFFSYIALKQSVIGKACVP